MLSRRTMLSRSLGALGALAAVPAAAAGALAHVAGGAGYESETFPHAMPVLRGPDRRSPRASAWSACIEMVCAAYGRHLPAERILQTAFVEAWPRPADNAAAADSVSRGWADIRGRPLVVQAELLWQNPQALAGRAWTGASLAAWQLRRTRPVLAEFGSHMTVLAHLAFERMPGSGGIRVVEAVIHDPMPVDGGPAARYAIGPREWQRLTALAAIDVADDPPPRRRPPTHYRRPARTPRPLPRPGNWRDVPIRW